MTNWRYVFDVNKYVREGGEPKEIAQKIYTELRDKSPFTTEEGEEILDALIDVETAEDFDAAWEQIYDYADERQVWLGL